MKLRTAGGNAAEAGHDKAARHLARVDDVIDVVDIGDVPGQVGDGHRRDAIFAQRDQFLAG